MDSCPDTNAEKGRSNNSSSSTKGDIIYSLMVFQLKAWWNWDQVEYNFVCKERNVLVLLVIDMEGKKGKAKGREGSDRWPVTISIFIFFYYFFSFSFLTF